MQTFMNGGGRQMLQLLIVLLLRFFKERRRLILRKSVLCAGSKNMKRAFFRMINLTKWNKHKMDCHTSHTQNQQHRFLPNNLLRTTHFICQPLNNLWSTLDNIFCHSYEHASKENKILNAFARCCVGRGNEVEQDCVLDGVWDDSEHKNT